MRPPLSKELWFVDGSKSGDLKFKDWNGDQREYVASSARCTV